MRKIKLGFKDSLLFFLVGAGRPAFFISFVSGDFVQEVFFFLGVFVIYSEVTSKLIFSWGYSANIAWDWALLIRSQTGKNWEDFQVEKVLTFYLNLNIVSWHQLRKELQLHSQMKLELCTIVWYKAAIVSIGLSIFQHVNDVSEWRIPFSLFY